MVSAHFLEYVALAVALFGLFAVTAEVLLKGGAVRRGLQSLGLVAQPARTGFRVISGSFRERSPYPGQSFRKAA